MEKLMDFMNTKQTAVKFKNAPGVEFKIGALTLSDDAWIEATFTPEELREAFDTKNYPKRTGEERRKYLLILLRIFYRFIDSDSKKYLKDRIITEADEMGFEAEVTGLSGPEKLYRIIAGPVEFMEVIKSFSTARDLSNPILKDLVKKIGEDDQEKKSHGLKSTTE